MYPALAAAVGTYLLLCLLVHFFQDRLAFEPVRGLDETPVDIGLDYEEVELLPDKNRTEPRLTAWFIPSERHRGTLLFCHGNSGNLSDRLDSIRQFYQLGFDVFIFDYRGYGNSTGRPSERGLYRDAWAAWRHLTEVRRIPPERIVVLGRSLGGGVASWLGAHAVPGAVILESTFLSMPQAGADLYWFLPIRWIAHYHFNSARRMPSLRSPVLVAHSPDDEVIPCSHGLKLYSLAPEPRVFFTLAGRHSSGHLEMGQAYLDGLDAFLKTHFDPRQKDGSPGRTA